MIIGPEQLLPSQELFLASSAGDVLYGGEAYGGKSYILFQDAVRRCQMWPGYRAAIFRRHYGEMEEKFFPWARDLDGVLGNWYEGRYTLEYPNGSRLVFHHVEHLDTVHRFKGADFHYLGLDEMTEFEPYQLQYLIGRSVRGPKDYPRRIRATSNPDGPAHEWVKARYIDPVAQSTTHLHHTDDPQWDYECPYEHEIWTPEENGVPMLSRQFIRASWRDNYFTDRTEYYGLLSQLPEPARSAQRDGSWDITSETALSEFGERHVVPAFELDPAWVISVGVDQGFYPDPWCALFMAHDYSVRHPSIPGLHRIYVWGEFYAHRVTLDKQAQMIADRLLDNALTRATIYFPHDMRTPRGALLGHVESAELVYRKVLAPYGYLLKMAPTGPDMRAQKLARLHSFLSEAPDGKPWLQIMAGRAPNLTRTLPLLRMDPRDTDDIRKRGLADDPYDALGTVLLSMRRVFFRPDGRIGRPEMDMAFMGV